jgi:hypothetical protein
LRVRQAIALAALAVLLVVGLAPEVAREIPRRWRMLESGADRSLAERRFRGSGAAFDRGYVVFLEALAQRTPPGTVGVAILGPPREGPYSYLAAYHLAPVPVLTSPRRVPPRWIPVSYGPRIPPGWRVFAPLPGGALLEPAL